VSVRGSLFLRPIDGGSTKLFASIMFGKVKLFTNSQGCPYMFFFGGGGSMLSSSIGMVASSWIATVPFDLMRANRRVMQESVAGPRLEVRGT
jgi:hypothetical protein